MRTNAPVPANTRVTKLFDSISNGSWLIAIPVNENSDGSKTEEADPAKEETSRRAIAGPPSTDAVLARIRKQMTALTTIVLAKQSKTKRLRRKIDRKASGTGLLDHLRATVNDSKESEPKAGRPKRKRKKT